MRVLAYTHLNHGKRQEVADLVEEAGVPRTSEHFLVQLHRTGAHAVHLSSASHSKREPRGPTVRFVPSPCHTVHRTPSCRWRGATSSRSLVLGPTSDRLRVSIGTSFGFHDLRARCSFAAYKADAWHGSGSTPRAVRCAGADASGNRGVARVHMRCVRVRLERFATLVETRGIELCVFDVRWDALRSSLAVAMCEVAVVLVVQAMLRPLGKPLVRPSGERWIRRTSVPKRTKPSACVVVPTGEAGSFGAANLAMQKP